MSSVSSELKFLTLKEAARMLQISKRTVFRMVHRKIVPAIKVGGQWRIRESQFKKWIEGKENLISQA
jgi:excisionase family DNA binding protein